MLKKLALAVIIITSSGASFAIEAADDVQYSQNYITKPTSNIKITLGGSIGTQAGFLSQASAFEYVTPHQLNDQPVAADKMQDFGFVNDTQVTISAEAEKVNFKYGGQINLNADTSDAKLGSSFPAQSTMLYSEFTFGRFEAGAMNGATIAMTANPSAAATGGASQGDWPFWLNSNWAGDNMQTSNQFVNMAALPTDYQTAANTDGVFSLNNYANKISYYAPSWNGLSLGVTYIPDTDISGTINRYNAAYENNYNSDAADAAVGFKDVISGGFSYTNTYRDVAFNASALGQVGSSKNAVLTGAAVARQDVKAYELALNGSYQGFEFGGAYGSWGDSGQRKPAAGQSNIDTSYYSGLVGYTVGKVNTTLSYFHSNTGGLQTASIGSNRKNELNTWAVGMEYKLVDGFLPYIEYTQFRLKQKRTDPSVNVNNQNNGNVLLIGTKLVF